MPEKTLGSEMHARIDSYGSCFEIDPLGSCFEIDPSGSSFEIDPQQLCPSIEAVARYFGGPQYPLGKKTSLRIDAGLDQGLALVKPIISYRELPIAHIGTSHQNNWPQGAVAPILSADVAPHAKYIGVYVATLGDELEKTCRDLATQNKIFRSLLLDAVGTAMLDILGGMCDDLVDLRAKKMNLFSGCRMGPGLNDLPLESHIALFDLLGPETGGVRLNTSCVMQPVKSISAFVIFTKTLQPRQPGNKCLHCNLRNCQFRSIG
jgi:hypothetical protein